MCHQDVLVDNDSHYWYKRTTMQEMTQYHRRHGCFSFFKKRVSGRALLCAVLACHFASAFAALGLPPFFGVLLKREFGVVQSEVVGALYVLPSLLAAIAGPLWGAVADRFGKRELLVRAQLGLALSFALAGFSRNTQMFVLALMMQGILGGTFGASRAYLGAMLTRSEFKRALDLTEASPRLALVVAPIALGWCIDAVGRGGGLSHPIVLYRYLALLPLFSAFITLSLPDAPQNHGETVSRARVPRGGSWREMIAPSSELVIPLAAQFALGFSAVLAAPYFIKCVSTRVEALSGAQAGLLFGLPHLVYLLSSPWIGPLLDRAFAGSDGRAQALLPALILYGMAFAGQGYSTSLLALVLWRLVAGLGMTGCFCALHALLSGGLRKGSEGRAFGWIELAAKFGSVAGGLGASVIARYISPDATFFASSFALAAAALFLFMIMGDAPYAQRQRS